MCSYDIFNILSLNNCVVVLDKLRCVDDTDCTSQIVGICPDVIITSQSFLILLTDFEEHGKVWI